MGCSDSCYIEFPMGYPNINPRFQHLNSDCKCENTKEPNNRDESEAVVCVVCYETQNSNGKRC